MYPTRLRIQQFSSKPDPESCSIDSLKQFSQTYKTPISNEPLVIVAEAHFINAFIQVINIRDSPNNRVPDSSYVLKSSEPTQNINFGMVKAA